MCIITAHGPSGLWWRADGKSWWCWRARPARAEPRLHTDTEPDHPSYCWCLRNARPELHTPSGFSAQTPQEQSTTNWGLKEKIFSDSNTCLYLNEPRKLLLDVLDRRRHFLLRVSQPLQKLTGFCLNGVQIYAETEWTQSDWEMTKKKTPADLVTHTQSDDVSFYPAAISQASMSSGRFSSSGWFNSASWKSQDPQTFTTNHREQQKDGF